MKREGTFYAFFSNLLNKLAVPPLLYEQFLMDRVMLRTPDESSFFITGSCSGPRLLRKRLLITKHCCVIWLPGHWRWDTSRARANSEVCFCLHTLEIKSACNSTFVKKHMENKHANTFSSFPPFSPSKIGSLICTIEGGGVNDDVICPRFSQVAALIEGHLAPCSERACSSADLKSFR